MTNPNVTPSDVATVLAAIDPDTNSAGSYESGWVNMAQFDAVQALVISGVFSAGATLDVKLEQATDSAGAGAKDVDGKATVQLVQGTNDSQQFVINCNAEELDVNEGFSHIRVSMTIANASVKCGAVVLGHYPRYWPATPAATVGQVVS